MSVAGPLQDSWFVEASAGTGKTRELVQRIVGAIASGTPVEEIVAVTFTHAAAGEMKLRVREQLDLHRQASDDPAVRENVARALQTLDRAFIGTIHSFCATLLRQRPVEARVDPAFRELSEPEARAVFSRVFDRWIQRKLLAPSATIHRALARLAYREDRDGGGPIGSLEYAAWSLAAWRDHPAPWSKRPFDRDSGILRLTAQAAALTSLRRRASRQTDPLVFGLLPVAELVERAERAERAGYRDLDVLESDLLYLPRARPLLYLQQGRGAFGDGVAREHVWKAWTDLRDAIESFRVEADADLASALRDELWEAVELFGDEKRRSGQLDFFDLLLHARELLRHPEARSDLQRRYSRIFVDEFQDTDPVQAEILLLLAADDPKEGNWLKARPVPGKLFVVGDPKQSIYRFRRADAKLYERIRTTMLASGVHAFALGSSERSVEPIQQFVNAAFEPLIPGYLALTGGPLAPIAQPSIVALPMPRPYGSRNLSNAAIDDCAPDAIAGFVDWLVHRSGWTVRNMRGGDRVPVREEHICILFRRFSNMGEDLTQQYVRCLEARGLEHVLVGSKSFHQREEIGTIRTALRAVEWPDDELCVFAVLRGSLFSIADGTLLKFKDAYKRFHPFDSLPEDLDEEFSPVRDALVLLEELHRRRNHRPIADTIAELLEYTRAHAGFAFRPGGERVLANVYRLTDLARSFELTSATSFRSFVEYLADENAAGEAAEAPVLEQEQRGVKLMTVHRAKGLEFPVVILADLTAKLSAGAGADRWVDPDRDLAAQRIVQCAPWELADHLAEENAADRDEGVRIAYVAATRARDLLAVAAVGEQERDGWLSPLYEALYPPKDRWRIPGKAPGCPSFGDTTVLNRPEDCREEVSVRPGLHMPRAGSHGVVWFDPALLGRSQPKRRGIDNEALLKPDAEALRRGMERYEAWKAGKQSIIDAGSARTFEVWRAIDAIRTDELEGIPVEVMNVAPLPVRPAGRRFGRLVHAVLQQAGTIDAVAAIAAVHGRRLRATDDEVAAAAGTVQAVLQHPMFAPSDSVRRFREMPIAVRLEDGRMIEGVMDLAWTDGSSWTVVDYKTDDAGRQQYRRQLQTYALALRRATSLPVRAILLEV